MCILYHIEGGICLILRTGSIHCIVYEALTKVHQLLPYLQKTYVCVSLHGVLNVDLVVYHAL